MLFVSLDFIPLHVTNLQEPKIVSPIPNILFNSVQIWMFSELDFQFKTYFKIFLDPKFGS